MLRFRPLKGYFVVEFCMWLTILKLASFEHCFHISFRHFSHFTFKLLGLLLHLMVGIFRTIWSINGWSLLIWHLKTLDYIRLAYTLHLILIQRGLLIWLWFILAVWDFTVLIILTQVRLTLGILAYLRAFLSFTVLTLTHGHLVKEPQLSLALFQSEKVLFSGLWVQVSFLVADLVDPTLLQVSSIDSFGVVIWNSSCLWGPRNREALIMDESDELSSLLISDLCVQSDHGCALMVDPSDGQIKVINLIILLLVEHASLCGAWDRLIIGQQNLINLSHRA